MFPKANSLKDLLIHLAIMLGIVVSILLIFFYVWLPYTTHHDETITVPTLKGMAMENLEDFLNERDLRFEINDSTYIPGLKPYTVISQHPIEGSKVKKNRKIYITVASRNPPKVKMPNLIDKSLRHAEMELKGMDLVLGKINMVPGTYQNVVRKQFVAGVEVLPGSYVPKGTTVDVDVSTGATGEKIEAPDLTGLSIEEVKTRLDAVGLAVGAEITDATATAAAGTVVKQRPAAGEPIQKGEQIDLWLAPSR